MVNAINDAIQKFNNRGNPFQQPEGTNESVPDDIVTKLERLSILRERGILSDVEFLQAKEKIIDQS